MQNNFSPSVKGVFKIMANSHLQNGVNANEINAANAATATPAPVAEQKVNSRNPRSTVGTMGIARRYCIR